MMATRHSAQSRARRPGAGIRPRLHAAAQLIASMALVLAVDAHAQEPAEASSPEAAEPTIPVNTSASENIEPTPTATSGNRLIEEIVVTAQKREESIQDVPISIQAFSGEALAARGIQNTTQLSQSIPGLQFTDAGGYSLIYIRGIGTDNFIPSADPSIATYVDGIYVPSGEGGTQSLGNIKRVEVLKGPQGTLFGRNATGGAISIFTEEPGDEFKSSAEAELGRFSDRSAKLNVSGPVTDWFSAGVSGAYSHRDSYYTDTSFQPQPDESKAARLKLYFHPTEHLSLALTGSYTDQQATGSLLGKNTNPSLLGRAAGIQPQTDDYQSESDLKGSGAHARQKLYYGILTWNLPWFDVKLLGSDQNDRAGAVIDFDGSRLPIAAFTTDNQFIRLQTGELQVVSNDSTWGADSFKWVSGLYYFHSTLGYDPAYLRAAPQAIESAAALAGLQLPTAVQDLLDQAPVGNGGVAAAFTGILKTDSYSTYAQGTYTFTDWLDLTLGGRYQREKRFLTRANTTVVDPTGLGIDPDGINFPLPSATASNFSPKAVLSFHPHKNTLIFASYSVGYKSGTFNIVNVYLPPNYIVPEKVESYELGVKADFLDGLLRLNAAVFDNRIKNLQSGFISLLSGGGVQFNTVPAARTRGLDFDANWLPLPNVLPGFAITGNAAYVDAIYTDYPKGPGFQKSTGLYSNSLDLTGDQIVRAPKVSGGLGLVQNIEMSQGSVEIAVDEYYNSGFYYDAYNTVKENPYAILNARLSYFHSPWNLRVTAFGKNLLDRRYHIGDLLTDFGVNKTLAAPREYGVRVNWNF